MAKRAAKRKALKRTNGEGSIYELPNGRWRAEITLPPDLGGKRRRRTRTEKTKSDAAIALRELQNEAATKPEDKPDDVLLSEWLRERHQLFAAGEWAHKTLESRSHAIERHLIPFIGDIFLSRLTPTHVEGLIRKWTDAGVGMRSREIAYRILKSAVATAQTRGRLACDPFQGIERPKARTTRVEPYTAEEVMRILRAAKGERLEALWWVALGLGMRIGEITALSPRAVDLNERKVRVERTGRYRKGKCILREPKTERSKRTIEIPPAMIPVLNDHRARMLAEGYAGGEFFFPNQAGNMIHLERLRMGSWTRILKRAKVARRTIHQCRHSYATIQLTNKVPVPVVSAVLGHANPTVTLGIYAAYIPDHQSIATDAMDQLLKLGG